MLESAKTEYAKLVMTHDKEMFGYFMLECTAFANMLRLLRIAFSSTST